MILIFEQDKRPHQSKYFDWKPGYFTGAWKTKRTWRIYWSLWSLSYYPEEGLRDFMDHIEEGCTSWPKK